MKLLDGGRAPNPRRVRIFLAEKGISVPVERVDLGKREHMTEAFRAINPLQRLPVLILDDDTVLTESIAICRYFEALHPDPPLFGTGARGQALVEMWNRRIEFELYARIAAVFRHGHPAMAESEKPQVAEWSAANRPKVAGVLAWIDDELAGRPYIAGDAFSVADITAYVAIDFMKPARLTVPDDLNYLASWRDRVAARPSMAA